MAQAIVDRVFERGRLFTLDGHPCARVTSALTSHPRLRHRLNWPESPEFPGRSFRTPHPASAPRPFRLAESAVFMPAAASEARLGLLAVVLDVDRSDLAHPVAQDSFSHVWGDAQLGEPRANRRPGLDYLHRTATEGKDVLSALLDVLDRPDASLEVAVCPPGRARLLGPGGGEQDQRTKVLEPRPASSHRRRVPRRGSGQRDQRMSPPHGLAVPDGRATPRSVCPSTSATRTRARVLALDRRVRSGSNGPEPCRGLDARRTDLRDGERPPLPGHAKSLRFNERSAGTRLAEWQDAVGH